jgi:uncharacterized damage-inducible protein DinB
MLIGSSPRDARSPVQVRVNARPQITTNTDGFVAYVYEGVPVWQMLVHVVNHGTQHRAEAAALLTAEGRSPGELDLINYAEEQVR